MSRADTGPPFDRVLIANRGEIACRIIDTCRKLGIESVAVYSDADRNARHTRLADQAVLIGQAEASQSYLNIERIVQAARHCQAQAIHPGYGFLSENAAFARAIEAAGLVMIGPTAKTIDVMGSKAEAKALMAKAQVPLVPGYHGEDQSDESLRAHAVEIGFPLMLKAAAGGGGKGMRIVHSDAEFLDALAAARREARAAFGNERMILERYIEKPRHIEAQIFGDQHGQIIHLFERDCSSQRRHQKVIEEAPAADLDPTLRDQLLGSAVAAAQAVQYVGAGTVEFLVDQDAFYFLEMNTRLQVEHPVTESITGQDLVEWQLRIAAGQALPLNQEELERNGHAMEARIYAEDPNSGFLPASGTITALSFPEQDWIRVDRGVESGDEVSVHYDPMIAKLIVSGQNRDECLARLQSALAASFIGGLTSNLGFLQLLANNQAFQDASLDTGYLDRNLDALLEVDQQPPHQVPVIAAAHVFQTMRDSSLGNTPWSLADGWRIGATAAVPIELEIGGLPCAFECKVNDDRSIQVITSDNECFDVQLNQYGTSQVSARINDKNARIWLHQCSTHELEIVLDHRRWPVSWVERVDGSDAAATGSGQVVAPMPGKVIQLAVDVGDPVTEGQTLALMEAMKMELSIKADISGTVKAITVQVGDLIDAETQLMDIEPPGKDAEGES